MNTTQDETETAAYHSGYMHSPEQLSLAYSPCPNDTFIFAAWTCGLLPGTPPVQVVLDDVEALNLAAKEARYELTKVSYGAIPALLKDYRILRAGGALGRGCGPLVVARPGGSTTDLASLPAGARIAVPGVMTTAYLLLRLALGRTVDIVAMRFDRIIDAVANGAVDAGLIIHESRFTYKEAGLIALADLGEWWERASGRPIPLGAILVRRDVSLERARTIDATISASLRFAYERFDEIKPYVREHAFEMNDDVMRAHIDLYVNDYSFDVGADGEAAVRELYARASAADLIPPTVPEFV